MARRLIGYEEITANSSGVTSSSPQDVTGLSMKVEVGSRPIMVEAYLGFAVGTNNVVGLTYLRESSTQLDLNGHAHSTGLGTLYGPRVVLKAKLTPTPGEHTYKVSISSNGSATVLVTAGSTNKSFIVAWEL